MFARYESDVSRQLYRSGRDRNAAAGALGLDMFDHTHLVVLPAARLPSVPTYIERSSVACATRVISLC